MDNSLADQGRILIATQQGSLLPRRPAVLICARNYGFRKRKNDYLSTRNPPPTANVRRKRVDFTFRRSRSCAEEQPVEETHKFRDQPGARPGGSHRYAGSIPAYEDLGALPDSYGEDVLFLVARDPRWLFCYWDFDWTPLSVFRHAVRLRPVFPEGLPHAAPSRRRWWR